MNARIFDVDGTLAETEAAHRAAFNAAFAAYGLNWHWSVETDRILLRTTGGKRRRIAAYQTENGGAKLVHGGGGIGSLRAE